MLVEQLMQHPYATHDDGPDALEMAVETVQVPETYTSYAATRHHVINTKAMANR